MSAVCDVLQKAQVIANDKLIASFGKSRLWVDATNPRVELTVTTMADGAGVAMGGG
jgi:hypothetical protein